MLCWNIVSSWKKTIEICQLKISTIAFSKSEKEERSSWKKRRLQQGKMVTQKLVMHPGITTIVTEVMVVIITKILIDFTKDQVQAMDSQEIGLKIDMAGDQFVEINFVATEETGCQIQILMLTPFGRKKKTGD